jgi:5-deoxy-glucuronate isomerase
VTARRLHWPAGSLSSGPWAVDLSVARAGWSWASLRVLPLAPGGTHLLHTIGIEVLVLPLSGSCTVEVSACGEAFTLTGRSDVFEGASDFAYLPPGVTAAITSQGGGRFALPAALATTAHPPRYVPRSEVAVELRGAGPCSREVHNLAMPGGLTAERLLACEVITPAGNWSSFPPHKHDEISPGETELEEIYYFELAKGPAGAGMAYQRVYGTAERPIDLLAEVGPGDVVLVPHGWHGPSMAVPGYDLYYLNVMAGPGPRGWLIRDDPAHAWVRATWRPEDIDPRLPISPRGTR